MDTNIGMVEERRQYVRYSLNAKAHLAFADGSIRKAVLDNISPGGMLVMMDDDVPELIAHEVVRATINAQTDNGDVSICLECEMIRTEPEGTAFYFTLIDNDNRVKLNQLIDELNDMVEETR